MTIHRLQRWAIQLMGYQYRIVHKPTSKHANADALSRFPSGPDEEFDKVEQCLDIEAQYDESIERFPIDADEILRHTNNDPILRKVRNYVLQGWPEKLNKDASNLLPYFRRRFGLIVKAGIILLETEHTRVVVPSSLHSAVFRTLHTGHWGVVRTKQIARRYCWWPKMEDIIEQQIAKCLICQTESSSPPQDCSKWPKTQNAWERIHIDLAGPFLDANWLICVDAYSKYPFVAKLASISSASVISCLEWIFSIEGLPHSIVSDNGRQFVSTEFKNFCAANGVKHITSAPFHPASNGEAERFVRTFKTAMKKLCSDGETTSKALIKYLSSYRMTPHPVMGRSPAEILHGRQPRNLISLMLPDANEPDKLRKSQKQFRRNFSVGQHVYARNYGRGEKWIKSVVLRRIGNAMYLVKTKFASWKRHVNQLKPCVSFEDIELPNATKPLNTRVPEKSGNSKSILPNLFLYSGLPPTPSETTSQSGSRIQDSHEPGRSGYESKEESAKDNHHPNYEHRETPRRSNRIRKPVDRYRSEAFQIAQGDVVEVRTHTREDIHNCCGFGSGAKKNQSARGRQADRSRR